jgi:hypothetical protein
MRENAGEYVASHFKPTGQIDIKPGHQGTFPNLNWNQFGRIEGNDYNHPSPDAVATGHDYGEYQKANNEAFYKEHVPGYDKSKIHTEIPGQQSLF